ncbi:MAG: hypothetical protein V8T87_14450 [Victivallales bacterium]
MDKKSVALRLDGSVEFGHFPFDTCFVISCDEYPQDNQIVILKMRSGEILVRLFSETGRKGSSETRYTGRKRFCGGRFPKMHRKYSGFSPFLPFFSGLEAGGQENKKRSAWDLRGPFFCFL